MNCQQPETKPLCFLHLYDREPRRTNWLLPQCLFGRLALPDSSFSHALLIVIKELRRLLNSPTQLRRNQLALRRINFRLNRGKPETEDVLFPPDFNIKTMPVFSCYHDSTNFSPSYERGGDRGRGRKTDGEKGREKQIRERR